MAYITLTGVLVDANDNLIPKAQIKFFATATSSAVLEYTSAIATTDTNGQYTVNLNHGVYDISVKTADSYSFYRLVKNVVINAETTETNLNALISKYNEVELITPEILVTMRALEVSASDSADAAATSASAALTSENNASTSEANAATSESNASTSENNAATSEFNASQSASAALTSENNASTSEANAATSEGNALASEQAAATSAGNASTSEANAATSAGNALTSEQAAATSEGNALASEQAASASESNAATSASAASISEDNAKTSELNAAASESNAATSEANALQSEQAAATSEGNASAHKDAAENFKNQASASASAAATSESNAANSETLALQYKDQAQAAFENTIKVKGQWDASTGSYPTTPENGDRYYVSGDGVVSGVDYVTGDTITYYTSIGWIHGDNTERVTSVSGKLGAVTLDKTDVGLANVRNVSGYSQSETDTLLDGKLNIAGTAVAANQLANARTINLAGDLSGSATFNGSADITITGTVANDSHNHTAIFDKANYSAPFDDSTNTDDVFSDEGLTHVFVRSSIGGWPLSYGKLLNVPGYTSNGAGALQILTPYALSYSSLGNPYFRSSDYSTGNWSGWKQFLDLDSADGRYLSISGKANDSNLLDGLNSSQFLRTDVTTTANGKVKLNGGSTIGRQLSGIDNGALRIGTGWGMDNNEIYNTTTCYIGTLSGTLNIDAPSIYMDGPVTLQNSISGNGSGLTNVDAESLDGLNSSQFLRSDTSDSMTGTFTLNGAQIINTSSSSWAVRGNSNGSNHSGIWFSGDTGQLLLRDASGTIRTTLTAGGGSTIGGSTDFKGDISITKNNPWITLDSPSSGDNGGAQGAGITIGESGYKGSAALHLTYTGDGVGHIGMGTVTNSVPQYEAIRLGYQTNTVTLPGSLSVGGSITANGSTYFENNSYFNSNGYAAYFDRDGNARSHIKFTTYGTSEWSLRVEVDGSLNIRRDSGTGVLKSNDSPVLTQADNPGVPSGGIIMWSGSIASIPSGWVLCDGSNGTPNLTDRFIVGAGGSYSPDDTGGSADAVVVSHSHTGSTGSAGSHSHTVYSAGSHQHTQGEAQGSAYGSGYYPYGRNTSTTRAGFTWGNYDSTSYSVYTSSEGSHSHSMSTAPNHSHSLSISSTGESGTNKNLPPYYALAYIMKT